MLPEKVEASFKAQKRAKRTFLLLSLSSMALVLRLVLMPLSVHGDLFFLHVFPSATWVNGIFDIYKYFAPYVAHDGYIYYPPLVGFVFSFSDFLTGILVPLYRDFLLRLLDVELKGSGASELFALYPLQIRCCLAFLMKWAYLFFDLACCFLIFFAYRRDKEISWMSLLCAWLFHPVLLYGVYVFGQYRIIDTMFMWLIVFFLKRDKPVFACLSLSCILLLDNFGFIVLLPFILCLGTDVKSILKYFLSAIVPFAVVFIPLLIHSGGYVVDAYLGSKFLWQATHAVFPSIPYSSMILKTIFAGGFIYVFLLLLKNHKLHLSSDQRLKLVGYVWCALLLPFFAGTMTSVHYFLWVLPFFMILEKEGCPWPRTLNYLLIFLLFLFNLDSRSQNLGLFTPLDPNVRSIPSLHEILAQWIPWGKVIGISRMLFSILCLFMAWRLIGKRVIPLLRTGKTELAKKTVAQHS